MYTCAKSAIAIKGTATKSDLKESPFFIEFEYGMNNEGYATYDHMAPYPEFEI